MFVVDFHLTLNVLLKIILFSFQAITYDNTNITMWHARCALLAKMGENRKVYDGYFEILKILPKDNPETYMTLARDVSKVRYLSSKCFKLFFCSTFFSFTKLPVDSCRTSLRN